MREEELEIAIKVVIVSRPSSTFILSLRLCLCDAIFNRTCCASTRQGRKWRCGEVEHDSAILQGNLHKRLQKDDRCRLSREDVRVSFFAFLHAE